jgi:hypothetical protein
MHALICTQIEGIEPIHENWGLNLGEELDTNGDPPRVWDAQRNYPGTAFTRSIGDQIAEGLGVTANPEFLEYEMRGREKFIVLASDGVFEFLTSQTVGDIVARFYDPTEACRAVVAEAYRMWLVFETRTDDITIVVLELHKKSDHDLLSDLPKPQRSPATPNRRGTASSARRTSADGLLVSRDPSPNNNTFSNDAPGSRPKLHMSLNGAEGMRLSGVEGLGSSPGSPFASSPVGAPETNPRRRSFNSTGRNAMNALVQLAPPTAFGGVDGKGQEQEPIEEEPDDDDGEGEEEDGSDDDDGDGEQCMDQDAEDGLKRGLDDKPGRALMRTLTEALRQNYLFAQLPKRQLREAARLMSQQKIATPVGQPVIEPNSAANLFFLCLNGNFEVSVSAEMVRVRVNDMVSVPDYQAIEPEEYAQGYDDDDEMYDYEEEVAYAADALRTDDGDSTEQGNGNGDGDDKNGEDNEVVKLTISDSAGNDGSGGEDGGSNGTSASGYDFVLVHRYVGNWQESAADAAEGGAKDSIGITTDAVESRIGDRKGKSTDTRKRWRTSTGGLCCSFGELGLLKRQPRASRLSVIGHTRSSCGSTKSGAGKSDSLPADNEVVLYTLSRAQFLNTLANSKDAEVAKLAKMRLLEQVEIAKRQDRQRRNRNNTPQASRRQRKSAKSRRRRPRKPAGEGLKQRKLSSTV